MTIGIVGGGAWGTALAQTMTGNDSDVRLWVREPEVIESINERHENAVYLPGVKLSEHVRATDDLAWVAEVSPVLVVTPAQHMRSVLSNMPGKGQALILCSKGIEAGSQKFLHHVAAETVSHSPIAVLSGPTFAHEVAQGLPTAVTLAAENMELAQELAAVIARPALRPYVSSDVVGAEIGGAVKNVLAIACGVVDGAGLGQNARAALIARGFAEMTRYGLARGAKAETLAGLSGLGDLVLTCSSTSSRNFSLGVALGRGGSADAIMADRKTVAEGAFTAPVLRESAEEAGVDMPVTQAVCALLDGADVGDVIDGLLNRPLREEGV
ncbi:NAD(P)H-dependent glycerol-3-phosphate dehydrogenase [Stakelama tenebrarum]|uniref:Glycerol-3-phosphate dehydrogenase [NAD(P)+] n=1 Tax=Stakelama tenebrarum TaxID=2711215 RepID=A0A6G6Y1F2_9SPHN|nr:NAD(P)H-dependent glycerol-3-phosphate dehydrogenase [Sphingosinithalassobacter tenebrarum]QIG78637.1 NAD(P)-dependent glycerol-3-phosphate dehydrogenase [Sphingosinithalassobacter tenebrarum]